MKDSDVASICSRYSCVNFSNLPGFLNQLPKDPYILSNGPKFNGEDLTLPLEHIENFKTFVEILRVKKEDVFIRLFFDSFQGKCRKWIEGFPIRSIKFFVDFWHIFLETWMEKEEEFKIEVPSIQGSREWEDMCMDDEVGENFSSSLSSYLKSCQCSHEVKLKFFTRVFHQN